MEKEPREHIDKRSNKKNFMDLVLPHAPRKMVLGVACIE